MGVTSPVMYPVGPLYLALLALLRLRDEKQEEEKAMAEQMFEPGAGLDYESPKKTKRKTQLRSVK